MAHVVMLKQKDTGIIKKGFYGFSWTTFFFGFFPALFRQDFITFIGAFVVLALISAVTLGIGTFIATFVWAFLYNGYYTKKLLEKGYQFDDSPARVQDACRALKVSIPASIASVNQS